MPATGTKTKWTVAIIGTILLADYLTKRAVQSTMELHERIDVLGEVVRLTYIRNPGAAFGLYAGPHSRFIFLGVSLIALAILAALYRYTPAGDRLRTATIALIAAGAIGNIIDRLRSPAGVIDFVDVGLGELRWPVFNVADMAVTTGAILLALSLWREDRRVEGSG